MELTIIFVAGAVVALVWFAARPKSGRTRRRSGAPKLWDSVPGTDSALWGAGDLGASHHGSGHSDHDGGFHSSTNAPSDGGGLGGGGGGGDGG